MKKSKEMENRIMGKIINTNLHASFLTANQIKDGWYANVNKTYIFKNKDELLKFIKENGYEINHNISDINTIKAYNFCPDSIAKKKKV